MGIWQSWHRLSHNTFFRFPPIVLALLALFSWFKKKKKKVKQTKPQNIVMNYFLKWFFIIMPWTLPYHHSYKISCINFIKYSVEISTEIFYFTEWAYWGHLHIWMISTSFDQHLPEHSEKGNENLSVLHETVNCSLKHRIGVTVYPSGCPSIWNTS